MQEAVAGFKYLTDIIVNHKFRQHLAIYEEACEEIQTQCSVFIAK